MRFGGHAGAAGLTLNKAALVEFAMQLDKAVRQQVNQQPEPIRLHDGELDASDLSLALMQEIDALQPFGRGFESPSFVGTFDIINTRVVGKDPVHLSINVACGEGPSRTEHRTIWFRALSSPGANHPIVPDQRVRLIWRPVVERYRGAERLVPRIEGMA